MLFRNKNQTSVFGGVFDGVWFISVARTRVDLFQLRIRNLTSNPVRWFTHTWVSYQAPHIHRPTTSFGNSIKRRWNPCSCRRTIRILWLHWMSHFWKRVKLGEDSKWGKIKEVELVNPHLPFRFFSGSSLRDDFVLSLCGFSLCILSFVFHSNSCNQAWTKHLKGIEGEPTFSRCSTFSFPFPCFCSLWKAEFSGAFIFIQSAGQNKLR